MNNEELTCRTSEHGPEVTASPRPEYDDFTRSLREHVVAGEKLSAAIPPPLQSAAALAGCPKKLPQCVQTKVLCSIRLKSIGIGSICPLGKISRNKLSRRQDHSDDAARYAASYFAIYSRHC